MKEKCTKYNNSEYDEKEISMQRVTVLKSFFIVYYDFTLKLERNYYLLCFCFCKLSVWRTCNQRNVTTVPK